MFPGMNSRQARQMMQRMGIQQEDFEAMQVIIRLPDKNLVFDSPQVSAINMQGTKTFQVIGDFREEQPDATIEIQQDDIATVVQQTNCAQETAHMMLEKHNGDIAAAILEIQEQS